MSDTVVIMTGAGGGLGGAMARGLLSAGRRVVALDVAAGAAGLQTLSAEAEAAGSKDRLLTVTGSVRSAADCSRAIGEAIGHFGAVHVLVNCAALGVDFARGSDGMLGAPKFYEIPLECWEATIDTNVNGPFRMASAVTPHLIAQGWGRIVNIVTGYPTMVKFSPYGPAKAALEAATVVWSNELDGTGVTVNALLPGAAANTAMVPHEVVADRSRLVQPDVMVAPMLWFASRESDGISGYRIIGQDWDPTAATQANLSRAQRAGWGIDAPTSRTPKLQ